MQHYGHVCLAMRNASANGRKAGKLQLQLVLSSIFPPVCVHREQMVIWWEQACNGAMLELLCSFHPQPN